MICGYTDGRSPCKDSGSVLFYQSDSGKAEAVGISSLESGRCVGVPSAYTNVAKHLDFIKSNLGPMKSG
ncbi:hypothetical protein B4U80_12058 [Leptotrombidium deliense]|uniref:Peptidase S1 domain-containing protein n=1 Tax=Leptotrombidium deliense TaxID=299467 RepID=A0A443RZ37_9ACAR|nr:hypothetical protein B4U80_12058 [Leptotrombidium deliense]